MWRRDFSSTHESSSPATAQCSRARCSARRSRPKQQEDEGKDRFAAAVEACRLRLRPILMTSFAFILGVLPLARALGPGAEMRRALGTAVFSGMRGVTILGLFLTPVFYVALRRFARG